jgi:hypothetical protein
VIPTPSSQNMHSGDYNDEIKSCHWRVAASRFSGFCKLSGRQPASDLMFCADQAVFSITLDTDGKTEIHKVVDLPDDATAYLIWISAANQSSLRQRLTLLVTEVDSIEMKPSAGRPAENVSLF